MITQKVKLAYERHLFQKEVEAVRLLRDAMTADEYLGQLEKLRQLYAKDYYAFLGKRGQKSLKTVPNMLFLCSLLWGVADDDEMLILLKERQEDVSHLLSIIIKESFQIEDEDEGDTEG